jgi:quinoprotein glucose dehydrogenase
LFGVILSLVFANSASQSGAEWRNYGGDPGGMRFSTLKQIHRDNVAQLKPVWSYHTGELDLGLAKESSRPPAFECTPLAIGGVLYLSTPSSRVIALDAETGQEIWKFDPQSQRSGNRKFLQHRGVAYWEGPPVRGNGVSKRILYGTLDGRLIALDASTGTPCGDFGSSGVVDLHKGVAEKFPQAMYSVTSPPAIYKDLVVVGAAVPESPSKGPSGNVRAFDVRTGKKMWEFHTVPHPGETGHETWEGDSWVDRTGANAWGVISVDVDRGMVFLPLGSAAYDFYGADRKGQDLFANSVVALNAATGKLIWYYQTVHHDIWDYDLPAEPALVTVQRNGRAIPAVAQVTKTGFVFVLDRLTGKPLFPVEERPVPQSKVSEEASWPTQPIPLKPPAVARQSMTREDINNLTPEFRRQCLELFDSVKNAPLFTPLGLELTLQIPGTLGGANWSGVSFDPSSGYLYVNVNELPMFGAMRPQPAGSPVAYRRASPSGEYARLWDAKKRWSCLRPPWGTLSAVDLKKGEIAWKVTLGVVDELEAQGLPQTGALNLGGSIATAGGLVFIGATNDSRFRAFDSRTGKELWVTKMEASGHAAPITYLGRRSGRQYVVITAGGAGYFSETVSDAVLAFALPQSGR